MAQQCINGTGNIVVQIEGDGNHIVVGLPHLTLTRYASRRVIRTELDKLSPYTRSTPLLGRKGELASLQAFLDNQRPLLCRVLIGGGGSGKTRLALELCEQAAEQGWSAGFASHDELKRFIAQQSLNDWGWQRPTLIVVDYAAGQAQLLDQWLNQLADRSQYPHRLRLLLLERHADTESGWWHNVFATGGWGAGSKRALLDLPEPIMLQPISQAEDRIALLAALLQPQEAATLPMDDPAFREKLMQLQWGGDPLYLMMAALGVPRLGYSPALGLSRTDLAEGIAEHEAERLRKVAGNPQQEKLLCHFAACVTLAQGMEHAAFLDFAAKELAALHSSEDAAQLADLLHEALPRGDDIAPVLPDLIGEAFILRTLKQGAGEAAVLRCHEVFGQPVAETLIRCTQDFTQQHQAPLRWLEALLLGAGKNAESLFLLLDSLPTDSLALCEFNLQVSQCLYDMVSTQDRASLDSRSAVAHGLAIALAKAGMYERAERIAQDAVDINRKILRQSDGAHPQHLASSLNTLANIHSELGQHELALRAAQEATYIYYYYKLASEKPDVFGPEFAMTLSNLAGRLKDSGQHELAQQTAQVATDILREFATEFPSKFNPDFAHALHNLACCLNKLGQHKLAFNSAQDSISLYRDLASQQPDIFSRYLADSLISLAGTLSSLGECEPALRIAQEATDLYRKLAAQRPDVFRSGLVTSLILCVLCTTGSKTAVEALPLAHEAIATLLPDFLHHPDAHEDLISEILREYLRLCEAAGQKPDETLLQPLIPYFFTQEE